jgi:hypothetical protein
MLMFCESCKRAKQSEWMHNENLCLDCLYSKPKFKGKADKEFRKENEIKRRSIKKRKPENQILQDAEGPADPGPSEDQQMKLF